MEYTIKDLMKEWGLSRAGVYKRIKKEGHEIKKRVEVIKKRQIVAFVEIKDPLERGRSEKMIEMRIERNL